jgi:5-dehydro-4-deoxyglucarate dehydratase
MNPGELKETLSSGLLSFPITDFDNAVACDDYATVSRLIDEFFLPYLEIRSRRAGYAVSIIKAGARLAGYDAGPVRPPLVDLRPDETELPQTLIKAQGPQ